MEFGRLLFFYRKQTALPQMCKAVCRVQTFACVRINRTGLLTIYCQPPLLYSSMLSELIMKVGIG